MDERDSESERRRKCKREEGCDDFHEKELLEHSFAGKEVEKSRKASEDTSTLADIHSQRICLQKRTTCRRT